MSAGVILLSVHYDLTCLASSSARFSAMESEIIRKCLSRTELQCSFMEYRGMKVVYRRYASLFFIVGVEQDEEVGCHPNFCRPDIVATLSYPSQNELGVLEFIHALVETLDKYFENVCELDIMFNIEKAHYILGTRSRPGTFVSADSRVPLLADEMVTNGCIVETNKLNILKPILLLEKVAGK